MATITAGDFRNGKTFEMDGKIMQVMLLPDYGRKRKNLKRH